MNRHSASTCNALGDPLDAGDVAVSKARAFAARGYIPSGFITDKYSFSRMLLSVKTIQGGGLGGGRALIH